VSRACQITLCALLLRLPSLQSLEADSLEEQIAAHFQAGVQASRSGQFKRAVEEYQAVLRLDPTLAEAHADLGLAYHSLGDYALAVAEFEKALHEKLGRDVYTAIVREPGVTSDTSTARGIGVVVNGQRPSSSNFLLDGSENNNSLLSGPLLTIPPEAVQEFRFSTGNFSAEYGRTSGFVVNAVTRSGGTRWHGIGYLDFNGGALNANDFQRNAAALGRLPFHQEYFGVEAGGPAPLRKRWLFLATALDTFPS
jgi:tetratricopeptide (TPR) repeat protein